MTRPSRHPRRVAAPQRQRGIVMFIALISMVILSLAGIGLVRSVDTGSAVAGNIAFRQASVVAVNRAIEEAVDALYKTRSITNTLADDAAHHYFASLQAGEKADGTPAVLSGSYPPSGYSMSVWQDAANLVEVRYVIERVCSAAGAASIATCDLMPPKVSDAGTDNEQRGIPLPPIPHFRVTVRVDLPNTNSTSIAQAFLR
jgi:Tfp pilus assembly protein PilX